MLFNVEINAGRATEIAQQGRFINVVLAAGEITARIRTQEHAVFETKIVSGMAFPVNAGFVSVSFESDTTQQVKVWLADIPLTYAPIDAKAVGSSALESLEGQVFSDVYEMLPTKVGRNKITITPQADIFIGGVGLNAVNGIPVKAGETFSMQTQGAVYAYETSGAYQPLFQPVFTSGEVNTPETFLDITDAGQTGFGNTRLDYYFTTRDGSRLVAFNYSYRTAYVFNGDDLTPQLTIDIGHDYEGGAGQTPVYDGEYIYVLCENGYLKRFHQDTLALESERINSSGGSFTLFDVYNGKGVAMQSTKPDARIHITNNVFGEEWTQLANQPVWNTSGTNHILGLKLAPNGDIHAMSSTQHFVSTDNGVTWIEHVPPVEADTVQGFGVCKKTGYLFIKARLAPSIHRSIDGIQWTQEVSSIDSYEARGMQVLNGTVVVNGRYGLEVFNENLALVAYHAYDVTGSVGEGDSSACLTTSGQLIVSYRDNAQGNSIYRWKGSRILTGGVPVAIMQEVN
ncbi:hypothetical protein [Thalassotalea eurytherma]|uniref:Exo-alpha-sialidase n=1 Tax=Thalassotalea eurytherma TaxID=1144278 RepID=A0ABQ6H294_9GAMM|nr:hypothetical protein [Thalassotalea eurytherma]GLX80890.1 hypothetical protein theurythT_03420 [Thalassotalea eurytherma]